MEVERTIHSLKLGGFRCFHKAEVEFGKGINLFTGANGSGKTSLIEALDVLSRRRTFRTGSLRGLLRQDAQRMVVVARLGADRRPLVVEKEGAQEMVGRMGNQKLSRSQQSRLFPLRVIHSGCHEVINTPSLSRQHIIDWGVFHVEHRFFDYWRDYCRTLAQRNKLLYERSPAARFRHWDERLSSLAEQMDLLRREYVARLKEKVERLLHGCWSETALRPQMSYLRGWAENMPLVEVLKNEHQKDQKRGYTQKGAHRARIVWSWPGRANFCPSGGQRKMLFSAMLVGQILLCEEEGRSCCLAVDDFASELDEANQNLLWCWLGDVKSTVLVTSLSALNVPGGMPHSQFQLLQGRIKTSSC